MTGDPDPRLIAVARGQAPPDLVIEGGRVFLAFTKEWVDADVAIAGGRIAGVGRFDGGQRIDARGGHVVPGFIDAHMHIESTKLMADQLARILLTRGTTAIVCDPHEIANVLGARGVHWFIDAAGGLPLTVWFSAPSCVPASEFESPFAAFSAEDLAAILARPEVIGLAEMMDFPAVIRADAEVLGRVGLAERWRIDGHAPGVSGPDLDAYLSAGISTDHESSTLTEAIDKRRRGCWVLMREASGARNLRDLLPLVSRFGPEHCAFCTDDREPDMLLREGHIDQMCRIAVADGIAVEDVLLLATLHPARAHRLAGVGAIAPGFAGDCVVLDDLIDFRARHVVAAGRLVVNDGACLPLPAPAIPDWVRGTVNVGPLDGGALVLPAPEGPARAIGIRPGQLVTDHLTVDPPVRDGQVVADPVRDLVKLAVVERHHATGRVGLGLLRGTGLQSGAFATTVSHDAHNVVVAGVDDDDMLVCVRRLAELGGGCVVSSGGRIHAELPLPIAGLMSDEPAEVVVEGLDRVHAAAAELGVTLEAPFMALSFLGLSVIPHLKLTDRGLVDVDRFALVPFAAGLP